MTKPQGIAVLGATGSVGCSTLDVIARHPERYRVVALSGHRQLDKLFEQASRFRPDYLVVADADAAAQLALRLEQAGLPGEVLHGPQALEEIVRLPEVDAVMAAIVGAAGLPSALAAAGAGKRILLANKESLVVAGRLFMDAVRRSGAGLLPVDSEHSAIFQSLPADYAGQPALAGIRKIILTASGGPFRGKSAAELLDVTPADACRHPNWSMGRKISVDSASLMNKGLEVIEAHWLFGVPPEQIEVVVHPQSVIHSMVQYRDGSVIAQLGSPDMRTPIACALAWPERIDAGVEPLDFFSLSSLSFEKPDLANFPCLRLAFDALAMGGDAPAVLNAANEVAVDAFLNGRLRFVDIPKVVSETLSGVDLAASASLDALLARDEDARRFARGRVAAC
ncbi:1-deoxy-D-xylulose-5-phosphate reductoisomerase [Chromobacterium subtsugae]|uniref:1-deoxy-D-xylulose 5-phosphate reductoisomerase n=1 Tax=Chromobacterium subtsugae TaxID=251747 RepID=A0ABS7FCX1_9NEIS|nr:MULTISPECIES: 1-deoxy-D-xylulose-5-phosphate reductoisomerase [Chromobacterium]KUM01887.1 1-deoxy-D-xylulose 5-phosphate reductoisomerase [Chromobacterium subtsugae]KZE88219.1 1-deoxy-D-xylulose 5-phosphate reductoisomerase [Chromobacterium sp. F49]MBW7565600.1 1-deoxy-D-xylulose-5-phosphate reductoisomerase [Chromobacterium subtsugae]MBW8287931.1 1-deoxy-D-xylulose-5-phosphate reductoisomerase [Chromobacterium subtsugae]OBU86920.1 1-deoxy-D-xylulose 5-phosphate reductoisomerase [Chromobact